MPVPLMFGGELRGLGEECVEGGAVKILPFQEYGLDFLGVVDVC